jgi:hypothetical protein
MSVVLKRATTIFMVLLLPQTRRLQVTGKRGQARGHRAEIASRVHGTEVQREKETVIARWNWPSMNYYSHFPRHDLLTEALGGPACDLYS